MEYCKHVITPMVIGCELRKEYESKEVDQRIYGSMMGSLLYVAALRPNAMQVVRQVAIFQETSNETHVLAVKRILRYPKRTKKFGLWYLKEKELTMVAYIDADWEGSIDGKKSTSGATFYLGDCLTSSLRRRNFHYPSPHHKKNILQQQHVVLRSFG